MKLLLAIVSALLMSSAALAEDYSLSIDSNYNTADPRKYFRSLREYEKDKEFGVCFPFGCGGIQGPLRNPDASAREPQNLTACMYDASGTLLYEREGKVCPYKWQTPLASRVELRKQQWLKEHR